MEEIINHPFQGKKFAVSLDESLHVLFYPESVDWAQCTQCGPVDVYLIGWQKKEQCGLYYRASQQSADKELRKRRRVKEQERRKALACELCKKTGVALKQDHDHSTGINRGLLCNACNVGLGMFKDSPDMLLLAVAYLTYHKNYPGTTLYRKN